MFHHLITCGKIPPSTVFVSRLIEGEVFLVWDGGDKVKSQKDLAKGAKLGIKDDIRILDYYRFYFFSAFINLVVLLMISGIHEKVVSGYLRVSSFHLLLTPSKYERAILMQTRVQRWKMSSCACETSKIYS